MSSPAKQVKRVRESASGRAASCTRGLHPPSSLLAGGGRPPLARLRFPRSASHLGGFDFEAPSLSARGQKVGVDVGVRGDRA